MSGRGQKRDRWLEDVDARQRNVVFPDTVQNEGRLWRNLSERPLTTTTKIGFALLALLGWGFFIRMLFAMAEARLIWPFVLGMVLLWGPIFGILAWAINRALRNIQEARRKQRR